MKRIPELDSIRGLAVITILLYHLAPARFHYGWASVDCFFVLSSYLITSILIQYREQPRFFYNFYARRSLRIWPIYYLSLLACVAVNALLNVGESLRGLPYYCTYTQNIQHYWGQEPPGFIRALAHTWTLALEEQYYLIWPLVVYFCGRRALIAISLVVFVASIAARLSGLSGIVLGARCDGFALGGLLAVLLSGRNLDPEFRKKWGLAFGTLLATTALLLAAIISGILNCPELISPFSLAFAGLIGLVILRSGDSWLACLRLPALMFIGTISYGLYLYHIPIDRGVEIILRKLGVRHGLNIGYPLWRTVLELALSFIVATLSWHFIEKPILGLKRRFEYRELA